MYKYERVIDYITVFTKHRPTQTEIAKILGYGQTAIAGRKKRNAYFKLEELKKIEQFYNISGLVSISIVNNLSKETFSHFSDIQLLKTKKIIDEILQERIEQI